MPSDRAAIWTTVAPVAWPPPPTSMSISRLVEGETCPRRAALRAADYPAMWPGRGYPSRFALPALVGEAAHAAVGTIVTNLRNNGCASIHDAEAINAIMAMGGYTRIAEETVSQSITRNSANPRFAAFRDTADRMLRSQLPEIRRRIQALMCQVTLGAIPAKSSCGSRVRSVLMPGVFSEVWLEAADLNWAGRADQVLVAQAGAEITEFKTGEAGPEHAFQLLVYALLWTHDRVLNPSGRSPVGLQLRYPNRCVQILVPTAGELEKLAGELTARTERVNADMNKRPPPTRFQPEECRQCDVRQICDEYWKRLTPDNEARTQGEEWADVEATVLARHGPTSYDARIEAARFVAAGAPALIRLPDSREFQPGERVRILGTAVSHDEVPEGGPIIIRVGTLTEIYVLPVARILCGHVPVTR